MKVHWENHLDEGLPTVDADPEGIHRALLNVITNALDAVEGRDNPKVVVQSLRDSEEGWVRIHVVDNGTGIPPNHSLQPTRPLRCAVHILRGRMVELGIR